MVQKHLPGKHSQQKHGQFRPGLVFAQDVSFGHIKTPLGVPHIYEWQPGAYQINFASTGDSYIQTFNNKLTFEIVRQLDTDKIDGLLDYGINVARALKLPLVVFTASRSSHQPLLHKYNFSVQHTDLDKVDGANFVLFNDAFKERLRAGFAQRRKSILDSQLDELVKKLNIEYAVLPDEINVNDLNTYGLRRLQFALEVGEIKSTLIP